LSGLVLFESMHVITQSEVFIVIYCEVIVGVVIVVKRGGAIDGIEMLLNGLTGIIEYRLAHSY